MEERTVDLFVLDLPYANKVFGKCTAMGWDSPIDLAEMWVQIKRVMKPNAVIIHFCNTKFGFALIQSNPKWFRYDLIWKKSRKVGFLSANKQPLRQHENIYVFDDNNNDDIEISKNKDLRKYAEKVFKFIEKTKKQIIKKIGQSIDHFFRFKSSQFGIPTKETYDELIKEFNINEMNDFLEYDILVSLYQKEQISTYNPQKTKGKPYKTRENDLTSSYYRDNKSKYKQKATENKGDRHPTSIIDHENMYIFKEEQGTYNPQKTEGKPYIDNRTHQQSKIYMKDGRKYNIKQQNNKGKYHPTSVIDHENMYIFKEEQGTYNPQKTEGKPYNRGARKGEANIYDTKRTDAKPNKGDRHPTSIIDHENMYVFKKEQGTYNPQKTEGKEYKSKEWTEGNGVYIKDSYKRTATKDTKHRHPTSIVENTILEHNNPHKTIHRTQKPVSLLEWLIKTYSNEGDVVMDFCMGSGTAGVACLNTKRNFIGIEKDEDIYNSACERIEKHVINVP
tara:strand:- start:1413 stop:2924 length:1512 start_codon:yes stop_codon:yes gene_type:complete